MEAIVDLDDAAYKATDARIVGSRVRRFEMDLRPDATSKAIMSRTSKGLKEFRTAYDAAQELSDRASRVVEALLDAIDDLHDAMSEVESQGAKKEPLRVSVPLDVLEKLIADAEAART